ncbi:MAG: hypothetical protein V7L22_02330 [Nostoc sp.]|uniref:hypothetical protein n=1 Tax=Nostoc sp. TaxID=1180 RepID=UPI002FF6F2E5
MRNPGNKRYKKAIQALKVFCIAASPHTKEYLKAHKWLIIDAFGKKAYQINFTENVAFRHLNHFRYSSNIADGALVQFSMPNAPRNFCMSEITQNTSQTLTPPCSLRLCGLIFPLSVRKFCMSFDVLS